MSDNKVTIFRSYDFKVGQKIFIEGGRRGGDWEVIGVTDNKVQLRCPFSQKEVSWVNFCYFVEETTEKPWPDTE